MALFPDDTARKDGIQLGGPHTLCYKCELERRAEDRDSDIPYGKLQYKEVFKIRQDGVETVLCMKHFREMCATSHYALIDTNECVAVPLSALDEQTTAVDEEAEVKKEVAEEPKEEEKPKKKAANKKKEGEDK